MNLTHKVSYLLGFIIVLGFSLWLVVQINESDLLTLQQSDDTLPDAYARQVVFTQMNEEGRLKSRFYADELKHYKNGITTLEAPYGILYDNVNNTLNVGGVLTVNEDTHAKSGGQKPPWTIKADHGELRDNGNLLYLWGHVNIHQDKGKNNQATLFTTEALTYYPKTRIARTKEAVQITQSDGSTVTARGMNANLDTGEVDFLSQVRSRYEIQP
jgi:lipopolysaccharide export system protein LptC